MIPLYFYVSYVENNVNSKQCLGQSCYDENELKCNDSIDKDRKSLCRFDYMYQE